MAAAAGGAGSALLSGLAVNQQIVSPEGAALLMIGAGGATAYLADGNARIVGHSMASAGAGQLALAMMGRRAMTKGALARRGAAGSAGELAGAGAGAGAAPLVIARRPIIASASCPAPADAIE